MRALSRGRVQPAVDDGYVRPGRAQRMDDSVASDLRAELVAALAANAAQLRDGRPVVVKVQRPNIRALPPVELAYEAPTPLANEPSQAERYEPGRVSMRAGQRAHAPIVQVVVVIMRL